MTEKKKQKREKKKKKNDTSICEIDEYNELFWSDKMIGESMNWRIFV